MTLGTCNEQRQMPFRLFGANGFDRLAGRFGEWAAGGLQGGRFATTPSRWC
jgi:hypothetical protein